MMIAGVIEANQGTIKEKEIYIYLNLKARHNKTHQKDINILQDNKCK